MKTVITQTIKNKRTLLYYCRGVSAAYSSEELSFKQGFQVITVTCRCSEHDPAILPRSSLITVHCIYSIFRYFLNIYFFFF